MPEISDVNEGGVVSLGVVWSGFEQPYFQCKLRPYASHSCSWRVLLSAVLSEPYCASAFCLTLSTHWSLASDILLNSRMKNDRAFQVLCHQAMQAPWAIAVVHFQMSNKETAIEDFKASGLWSSSS